MNEQIESIFELPLQHKVAILLFSIVLIAGGYWFLFYQTVGQEIEDLKTAIDGPQGLRIKIAEKQGIANNLDKYREEVETLEFELKKALTQLPDKKEIDELLSRVSSVGRDSGLEIRSFRPLPESKRDYYAEVPVEMEVYGTYHQLGTFFDEVGHLSRIVNLDQFYMRDPKITEGEGVFLRSSVVATTFRFLDESERPTKEKNKRGKRRRRSR